MGFLRLDLNNINLCYANFYEDDPKTIIHVTLQAWHNKLIKRKAFKNDFSKELMLVAWFSTRCVIGTYQKIRKKEIEPFLLLKSSMNLSEFLNDEFFVKYETFSELEKMHLGNICIWVIRTFCLEKFFLKFRCFYSLFHRCL